MLACFTRAGFISSVVTMTLSEISVVPMSIGDAPGIITLCLDSAPEQSASRSIYRIDWRRLIDDTIFPASWAASSNRLTSDCPSTTSTATRQCILPRSWVFAHRISRCRELNARARRRRTFYTGSGPGRR